MSEIRRIEIRVIPRAKRRDITMSSDGTLVVKVTEPPEDGRANAAVLEAQAKHFGVPKWRIMIVRGASSRQKLVEISPLA